MNLLHIKDNACPTCGGRVKSESQDAQHCNGEWFESRNFECGFTLKFVPNYSKIFSEGMCNKSKEAKEFKEKRLVAKEALTAVIRALNVDEEFRNRALNYLPL